MEEVRLSKCAMPKSLLHCKCTATDYKHTFLPLPVQLGLTTASEISFNPVRAAIIVILLNLCPKLVFIALWCFICCFLWPCCVPGHGAAPWYGKHSGGLCECQTVIAASCEQQPAEVDMATFISLFLSQIIYVAL